MSILLISAMFFVLNPPNFRSSLAVSRFTDFCIFLHGFCNYSLLGHIEILQFFFSIVHCVLYPDWLLAVSIDLCARLLYRMFSDCLSYKNHQSRAELCFSIYNTELSFLQKFFSLKFFYCVFFSSEFYSLKHLKSYFMDFPCCAVLLERNSCDKQGNNLSPSS